MLNQKCNFFFTSPDNHNRKCLSYSAPRNHRQKGKFFELEYLFNQPEMQTFSDANKRKRRGQYSYNNSKALQLSTGYHSPNVQNNPNLPARHIHTTHLTHREKHGNPLTHGGKQEIIHCKKYETQIRTTSSQSQNRLLDISTKNEIKSKIRERILQGKDLINLTAEHKPISMTINQAYSGRGSPQSNQTKRSYHKNTKKQVSYHKQVPQLGEQQSGNRINYRKKQGKVRPWSPTNTSSFDLDELITII